MDIRYVPDPDASEVSIGPSSLVSRSPKSLTLLSPGSLRALEHPRPGLTTTIRVDVKRGSLRICGVSIEAEGPTEVTVDDLRGVRVVELLQENMPRYVEGMSIQWSHPLPEDLAQSVRDIWPALPAMVTVAETYGFAKAVRLPPIKAVMESYGVSRATAHRWVAICKDAGLIADG